MLPWTSRSGPSPILTVQRSRSGLIRAFFTIATRWPSSSSISIESLLDLHRVLDPGDAFLDLGQLVPVEIFEDQRLAQPQRLAVDLVGPLAGVGLDPVVIADGYQPLAHLVVHPLVAVPAPFAPLLTALGWPASQHRRHLPEVRRPQRGARGGGRPHPPQAIDPPSAGPVAAAPAHRPGAQAQSHSADSKIACRARPLHAQ